MLVMPLCSMPCSPCPRPCLTAYTNRDSSDSSREETLQLGDNGQVFPFSSPDHKKGAVAALKQSLPRASSLSSVRTSVVIQVWVLASMHSHAGFKKSLATYIYNDNSSSWILIVHLAG